MTFRAVLLCVVSASAVGCGGTPEPAPASESVYTVSGQLTRFGATVTSPAVVIQFASASPGKQSFSGRYDPQAGKYEVAGLPADTYKVTVTVRGAGGTGNGAPVTLPNSVEVTANKTLDIDLPR